MKRLIAPETALPSPPPCGANTVNNKNEIKIKMGVYQREKLIHFLKIFSFILYVITININKGMLIIVKGRMLSIGFITNSLHFVTS
jgi:hypothetical protein